MATIKDLAEQYGVAKAQDQNENLGKLAEMLGSARDIGNEYKVPSWVPLAGGTGAGDLLMGRTPEEIENWSYGNAPMQIPEMSNVPQFKRGRAQSLADALTTLAPGVKATEGLPAGLSFIGPKSRNWDKVAAELAAKKLDEGADPAEVWREHLIGRMPDNTLFSEISDKDANLLTTKDVEEKIAYQKILAEGMKAGIKERNASLKIQPDLFAKDIKAYNKQQKADADSMLNEITRNYGLENYLPKYAGAEPGYGTFSKNVYMHPELFENYPELGKSVTRFGGQSDTFHGSFSPNMGGGHIEIYYPSAEAGTKNSTMAHEMQHAIQEREGSAMGGSESMIRRNPLDYTSNETIEYAKSLPRYQEMDNDADRKAFIESFARMRLGSPFEAYRRLTGEAQARATQDRLDMDMAQRRENYPLAGGKLSDIPLEDLIYKYEGNGPSLAIKGYHGSPHKFKEFDTAHMGTGEGGQAYGWGNYITEDPYVATTYSPQDEWMDEQLMNLYNQAERRQDYPSMEVYERYMMHERPNEVKDYLNESYADYPEDLPKRLPAQKIGENLYKKQKGSHLYEVSMEFPKEREAVDPMSIEHFLDYDKPLSEQSDYVRNILQSHDPDMYHPEGPDYDPAEKGNSILQRFGSGKEGAQKLYELGIPGTTYMGEKSKVANPEGVRNFVTYSDEVPRVVTRNMNKVKPLTDEDRLNDLEKQMSAYMKTNRMPKGVDFKKGSDWFDWAYDKRAKLRGYAEGGEVDLSDNQQMKAIPQQPNLARLAELLQNAKSSGNQYSVPDWVPLLGGSGAGDMLLGNAPEEIENWSYGDMPMRVPEMSNVPQFKKGRAQSLADTAMLLAGPAESTARNAMAGNVGMIIKPKGGNWLDAYGRTPEKSASQFGRYDDSAEMIDWLKQKLGKYIKNEMGTPEDPVRRIAEEWPAKRDVLISQQQSKIPNLKEIAAKYEDMGLPPEVIASRMANSQRDISGIQEKISELEGYNPLHYKPRDPSEFNIDWVMDKRHSAGYPAEGIAKSDLGKLWEHYADENIQPIKVYDVNEMNKEMYKEMNHWLKKLNDEDQVYLTNTMVGTGFDKLADELRKATHPESDLPDFLRIDPAKLSRVSMPQAVEHAAKINAWRDAEKLKEGRNAATVMHKEYPDQGLSWMQMKMPEPTLQEGHYLGEDNRGNPSVLDTSGSAWSSASTPEEALAQYRDAERRDALKAALKFEGDTMGHCVGQYCDEVAGGDSNIYSLRDRRGEPHVTIETKPERESDYYYNLHNSMRNNSTDDFNNVFLKASNYNEANPHLSFDESRNKVMREIYGPPLERIVQIKGKQNEAPVAKYLPAIQDFVRSKDWSMVHDLPNSGLLRLQKYKNNLSDDIYNQALEKHGPYVTQDELNHYEDLTGNYAKGGSVQALHDKYEESDYGYGSRPDKTKKGLGYFGELERPDGTGVMTEYSIGVPINGEEMDVPTLIPTLTPDEIRLILHMQDGEDMPRSIVHKAIDHAHQRLSEDKPIFATDEDLYAHGGIVDVLHNDAIEQIMKAFMESMTDEEEPSAPAVSIQITTQSQPLKSGKIPTSIREAKHG